MIHSIPEALEALASGLPILVADDADRENEGDLVVAAEFATPGVVNFLARRGRGLLCAALAPDRAQALGLGVDRPGGGPDALHGTAFTASVDLVHGTTTGISAADRSATFRALANPSARPGDFARPGHVFPLVARPDGVWERRGHTEATVDLCRLAGLSGVGVLCEVMNDDGTMARLPDLESLARDEGIPLVTVADLVVYRSRTETPVIPLRGVRLPTVAGEFDLQVFAAPAGGRPLALKYRGSPPGDSLPLVRLHSECLTGDVFGSLRCDCGAQLEESQRRISAQGHGAVVYLRQEGRGIGLEAKLAAYELQDDGLDTVDANRALGFPDDGRTYREAAWILRSWGWDEIRLLTNNPDKVRGLEEAGIRVAERVPLVIPPGPHSEQYLNTKAGRMGHLLTPAGERSNR
jgi:3,4-dihydroxy 2-butanone 4-phosphate synthase/GTP cyclohydrolase II